MALDEQIGTVHDFSPRALGELKAWLEPWFLQQDRGGCCIEWEDVGVDCSDSGAGSFETTVLSIPDLWGYWRLGEDSGDTFADSSGNGRDLEINFAAGGTDTYPLTHNVTGALTTGDDGAVEFNIPPGDTSTQLEGEWLETASTGPGGTPLTAVGWIKCKASGSSMDDGIAFGTAGLSSVSIGWGFCVSWPARTLRYVRYGGVSEIVLELSGSLIADRWYFVAAVDDGTDHVLYVNAVEVDSTPSASVSEPGDQMRVGWGIRGGGSTSWQPFYGMVDEVAVWTAALSAAQILDLYTAGTT